MLKGNVSKKVVIILKNSSYAIFKNYNHWTCVVKGAKGKQSQVINKLRSQLLQKKSRVWVGGTETLNTR